MPVLISEPEQQRVAALRTYGLLDAAAGRELDAVVELAAHVAGVPNATLNLIDENRQCQLTTVGFAGGDSPRADSMCALRLAEAVFVHVPDASADALYSDNPWVTGVLAQVRCYASAPLINSDGHVLGTLCVFDDVPRHLDTQQIARLQDLAQVTVALFERRRQAQLNAEIAEQARLRQREADTAAARLRTVLETAQDAYVAMDADGVVTAWNPAAEQLFGWPAGEAVGRSGSQLFIPQRLRAGHDAGLARIRGGGRSSLAGKRLELTAVDRAGREFPVEMCVQVATEDDRPVFHAFLHDITERRSAQSQLETERQHLVQEHTFLQARLDSLDTGVAACDGDGRLALFNRALREVHGRAEQPLTAADWPAAYDLYAVDGQSLLQPHEVPLARAHAGEAVIGQPLLVRAAGGQLRRFQANASPIRTGDGRSLGAVVAMHDVTDAYDSEQRRRTRHAVAEALTEAGLGREAACSAVSAAAEKLGWAVAEYWEVDDDRSGITRVGSWTRPGHDLTAFTNSLPLRFARGQGLAGTVWRDGTDTWTTHIGDDPVIAARRHIGRQLGLHTAVGLPVRAGDEVVGVLALFTDAVVERDRDLLTLFDGIATHVSRYVERRRAEDLALALVAARRDFDRVAAHVSDYLWTVRIQPDGTVASVYASPNSHTVFGGRLPDDADLAATLAARIHPDDQPAFAGFHARSGSGRPAEVEVRVTGYDGVTRWVWTRATARRDGDRLFIDGICTDITERHQLAQQRLADEQEHVHRLQEIDRMKDQFVAMVVHELRNPIGVIGGYTELLLDDPSLTGSRELQVISRTGKHLQTLVDDLLDLARLDAGHTHIDPQPVMPARLLHEALHAHRPAADTARVTLVDDIRCGRIVLGDDCRLRQVIDNLLSNAIKYTPAGGTITVTARDNDDAGRPAAVITVADTGIGIPPEQYPQLFSRFFRASTATSRGIKGTGLGLAVTEAIVQAHGGTITAEATPQGGTAFTVTLPTDPGHVG